MFFPRVPAWSALTAACFIGAGPPFEGGSVYSGRDEHLQVALPRIETDVEIDGILDEPVWQEAARLTGFSQYAPVDGRAAANETEVLVWYSPTAIFFGVRAEAEPGSVRATLANRDQIGAEDSVSIFLNTFNDRRQAWVFSVNPLGVQSDGVLVEGTRRQEGGFAGLRSGREEPDLSPDFVFASKGRLTERGFAVELRIPFKTLRFQARQVQDWSLHVLRQVQSSGHEESWAPARRSSSSFLAQSGTLRGLRDLRRGVVLDLTPVATSQIQGIRAGSRWDYAADAPEVGGSLRWGVTPNLTLNGTFNPDFSQIESDVTQFAYDPRRAVFYPEKRPFFLDGIEQFETPNRLIYTRRLVSPLVAAKLTGKISGTSLAFLSGVDDAFNSASGQHHPLFNLLRLQRDLGGSSRAAFVFTDREAGPESNRVIGADARLTFADLYSLQLQAAVGRTTDPGGTETAPLWEAILNRNGRHVGFRYAITGIDEEFQAGSGFIPRGGVVDAVVDHRFTFYGRRGSLLESWSSDVVWSGTWRYGDFMAGRSAQDRKLHFNNNVILRGGWRAGGSLIVESFGFDPDLYRDYALAGTTETGVEILPFTGTPRLPNLDFLLTLTTPDFSSFSGSLFLLWGKDENFFEWSPADIVYATLTSDWRPTDQIRLSGQFQLQQFKRRSDGSAVGVRRIPRLKVEYQLTRSIFLRLVGEYDSRFQDALRDDSRSGFPIVLRQPATGEYLPALGLNESSLRVDALFSYQPTPGTVFFAGYGSSLEEPDASGVRRLRRTGDGFFFKLSYLFRL